MGLKYYVFPKIERNYNLLPSNIIKIDNRLMQPYHLKNNTFITWDENLALMMSLTNNDLMQSIELLS